MFASLKGAQLQRANLVEANLKGAILNDAKLQGANLRGAQLQWAFLIGAQLQGADLRGAQFQGAALIGAELQGARLGISADSPLEAAQLQGADLIGAQLQGADLRGAQLQGANLAGAQLGGADLRGAAIGGAQFNSTDNSMPPAVLDLADLREIERTPFSKEQYKEQYKKISEALERDIKLTHISFVTSSVTSSLKELKVRILEQLKALVCRPKAHCRLDTLDHVKHANQCLSNSPKLLLDCMAEDRISEYREALTPYLVRLACSDPSVARGVVEQAIDIKFYLSTPFIRSSGPPRDTLASALMAEQCEAVKALPEYSKKWLAKALETQ
jgi:hypothetical protein